MPSSAKGGQRGGAEGMFESGHARRVPGGHAGKASEIFFGKMVVYLFTPFEGGWWMFSIVDPCEGLDHSNIVAL